MKSAVKVTFVCLGLLIPAASVQSSDSSNRRSNLGLGRTPDSECRSFWITEVAYLKRLSQSFDREPWPGYYSSNNLDYYFSADVGWMKNLRNRNALGATLYWGADDRGSRIALKPRYRKWLTPTLHADVSIGVIFLITGGLGDAGGVTGNIAIGKKDLVTLLLQYEVIPYTAHPLEGPTITGTEKTLYGGIKTGSTPGAAALIIAPLTLLIYSVISISGSN